LYLLDRAYQSYAHLDRIAEIGSDFVVRLRSTAHFDVQEQRPLSIADRRAGVLSDRVVTPAHRSPRFNRSRAPGRNGRAGGRAGAAADNRLDLPAELIGLLYRHRWQIELFFRWIKCVHPAAALFQ